ncbi:MAG: hypothetical protein HXS44_03265 [Theionarchaea archaeon]|nr:hypothetical protein [Theionarchaea archaeon]
MFEEYAKIALAVDTCKGKIDGRKKLQKMIYIAKILGYPFRENYTLYWYGPYSHQLAAELKRMGELDIIFESKPDSSYIIELTESGKIFLNNFRPMITEEMGSERLSEMIGLFEKLDRHNSFRLELLATLFYFYEVEHRDFDTLKEVVKIIKPKFIDKDIREMARFMQIFIKKYSTNK